MDSPDPPDTVGAAQAQGQANVEAARVQGRMSNPNIVTPFGGRTVKWSGDQPTITMNLSPEQLEIAKNFMSAGQAGSRNVREVFSTPFSTTPEDVERQRQEVSDALYQQGARYLDPQYAQREEALRTRLANQGFQEGTEGYTEAMENLNRERTMSYGDLRDRAIAQGGAEQRALLAQQIALRQLPLNEVIGLLSGSQVGVPQVGQFSGTGNIQSPQIYDATIDAYNAEAGQASARNQAIGGIIGAGVSTAPYWLPALMGLSDRRLKSNIRLLHVRPDGLGWYEYDLFGSRCQGVMAQEVQHVYPDAVVMLPGGYLAVDYRRLA
jgi:hypothetical protein